MRERRFYSVGLTKSACNYITNLITVTENIIFCPHVVSLASDVSTILYNINLVNLSPNPPNYYDYFIFFLMLSSWNRSIFPSSSTYLFLSVLLTFMVPQQSIQPSQKQNPFFFLISTCPAQGEDTIVIWKKR